MTLFILLPEPQKQRSLRPILGSSRSTVGAAFYLGDSKCAPSIAPPEKLDDQIATQNEKMITAVVPI